MPMPRHDQSAGGPVFWKITGAGALFQAGSSAVDSATIVASLVNHLTGSVYAVGAASAVLRLGWLLPQLVVGYLAQRAERRMPYYVAGAFGRAGCLALIALMLAFASNAASGGWIASGFLALWTLYAFVSGIVAVPYNDIVGRSIPSGARSRMLAWRFFGGGILALGVTALIHWLLATQTLFTAYALIFALASALMLASSFSFVSAGEPPTPPKKAPEKTAGFGQFLVGGWAVLRTDNRFRLFLYTQWLGGATLMALPFYVVAAADAGLGITDVGILLGAQTGGALASNALWGRIGDRHGKLALLRMVGVFRLVPPLGALVLFATMADTTPPLAAFAVLFAAIGALTNGMTIGYLGYLMEISPDAQRPAYSAYFNALASPAALLPLVGALIADTVTLAGVFGAAIVAAVVQLMLYARLKRGEER
jgi:MFS family permease